MRLGRDLLKKEVVSLNNGARLGTIDDLYLGAGLERIAGLYLGTEGGLFNRTPCMIPFERVSRLGDDVILVENEQVVEDEGNLPQAALWTRLGDLRGRLVDTTGGTRIGQIQDVVFNEQGSVLGYRLSNLEIKGPVAQKQVIAFDTIQDLGHDDGAMTIDLARAEQQELSLG